MNDYTELFDGTSASPMGRLLSPPKIPEPVKAPILVIPPDVPVTRKPRANALGGDVAAALPAIWWLLETPRSVRELCDALNLPANATTACILRGVRNRYLVRAGHRKNEERTPGVRLWDRVYVRSAQYARRTDWPTKQELWTR